MIDGFKEASFGADGKRLVPRIPDVPEIPPDFALISRLQWGFYSVLTMLRARANWHRMLPPLIYEDEPTPIAQPS